MKNTDRLILVSSVNTLLDHLITEYEYHERLQAVKVLFLDSQYTRAFRFLLKVDRSMFTEKDKKMFETIKEIMKEMSRQKDSFHNLRNAILRYRHKRKDTMSVSDYSANEQLRIKQIFANMFMHEAQLENRIKVEAGGKNYLTNEDQIDMSLDLIIGSPGDIFNDMMRAIRLNRNMFVEDLIDKKVDEETAKKVGELLSEYFPTIED